MERFLGAHSNTLYALLRIVAGFLFACHGAQKMFGVLGGFGGEAGATAPLFSLMGLAGTIELVGGVLILLGLLTRWAAFIASGQMAVAYFMVHFPQGFFPIANGGELAALYSWLFLYFASQGGRKWALDGLLFKRGT
jgi:putative oxidoreductase